MRPLFVSFVLFLAFFGQTSRGQTYTISTFAGGGLPVNVSGISASIGLVTAVAVDVSGNVFIGSATGSVVLRLDAATGVLKLVAGNGIQGFSGDGGPATSAQVSIPSGIALDAAGNVYIADSLNRRVRKVSNGIITTVAGNGTEGFSGDGGPATSAQLVFPLGLAFDSAGNLYIADRGNKRVRMVSRGMITTVAGNGTEGFSGDGGPATSAQLDPGSVAVDSAGNLYISDPGHERVRKVTNGVITAVAGNGTAGFSGDNGPAANAQLSVPDGVAVDAAGSLYIADMGNRRIRKVVNGVITTAAENAVQNLAVIAVGPTGSLYIADDCRVRRMSNDAITTVAGNGSDWFGGDGGPAVSAQINDVRAVAVDFAGDVYIGEIGRIRKVSNGVITTVAVNWPHLEMDSAGNLYFGDLRSPGTRRIAEGVSAQLQGPIGDAVESGGNVYIAEASRDTARILKVSNGVITTVAGNGLPGFSGDGGPANRAQLNWPASLAVDSAGNLYIADTGNFRVRKVSGGVITTVAGNGTRGFSGDGGPPDGAQLGYPGALAVDSADNLYVADIADARGYRIRKISNDVITTIAGGGTTFGDNGPATDAQLMAPVIGIAVDSAGRIYVTDRTHHRVRVLTPSAARP